MEEIREWLIFTFETNHESAYAIQQFIQMQGAEGVVVQDKADFIKTFEEEKTPDAIIGEYLENLSFDVKIEAYFLLVNQGLEINSQASILDFFKQETADVEKEWIAISDFENKIKIALDNIGEISDLGKGYVGFRTLKDEDWQNNWKEYYTTLKFGNIVVNPSWIDYMAAANEVVLQLDPGLAFGTGSHETTSLILEILDAFDFSTYSTQNILDLGTGSGIQAIAAGKLFPTSEIDAIDIDENAVKVGQENAEKNQVTIHFERAELKDMTKKYDLIIANLIANLHLDLIQLYKEKIKKGGLLIASGIINLREDEVRQAFEAKGLTIIETYQKNDWLALVCQN